MSARRLPVLRFWSEVINGHNLDIIDQLMDPNYRQHAAEADQGPAGLKAVIRDLIHSSRGMQAEVVSMLEVDDLVITQTVMSYDSPPPGRAHRTTTVGVFRVRGQRIVEHWDMTSFARGPRLPDGTPSSMTEERKEARRT